MELFIPLPPPRTPRTASKVKPTALIQHGAGTSHGTRRQLLPSQAGWGGQKPREDTLASRKSSTTTHTRTHTPRSQPSEQNRVSMPRARLFSSLSPARSSELTGSAFIPPRRAAHGSGGGERGTQMKSRPRKQFLFFLPASPLRPPPSAGITVCLEGSGGWKKKK